MFGKSISVAVGRVDVEAKKAVREAFAVEVEGGTVTVETIGRSKAVKQTAVATSTTVAVRKSVSSKASSSAGRSTVTVAVGRL